MQVSLPLLAPRTINRRAGINHLAYSPDGSLLALSDTHMCVEVRRGDETVFSVKLATYDQKVRPTERIRGLSFTHDGKLLLIAAGDKVSAIDVERGELRWDYRPPRSFGFLIVSPIALATSLGHVAAAFDNGSFAIWSEDGVMRALWHENDCPRYMAFLPDGDRLVGCDSFSLGVWNVQTRKREYRIKLPDRVYSLTVSPGHNTVAARTLHEVLLYDGDEGKLVSRLPIGAGLPLAAFHPTESVLALGDKFGVNLVTYDGTFLERLNTSDASVLSLTFTPDGEKVVAGLSDRTVQSWPFLHR